MTFQAPKNIPGLDPEPNRALVKALGDIQRETDELGASIVVTDVKTSNYGASFGEHVLTNPPAAGMLVLLPTANNTNSGQRITISVLSVTSGGTVTVSVIDQQLINGAATKVLSTEGLAIFESMGEKGWSAISGSTGGGGGADWSTTLGLGATSGAHDPIVDVGQFLQLGLAGPVTSSPQIRSGDAVLRIRGAGSAFLIADGAADSVAIIATGASGNAVVQSNGATGISQITAVNLCQINAGNGINCTSSAGFFQITTNAIARLVIANSGEWTTPTGGALNNVLTHQGAGVPPIWAPASGGGADPRILAWWGF